jgi:hypothetical protein
MLRYPGCQVPRWKLGECWGVLDDVGMRSVWGVVEGPRGAVECAHSIE